ncbi:MAG: acyl-CoA dehydrogenase family protein [Acidimicrobiales bacterium]
MAEPPYDDLRRSSSVADRSGRPPGGSSGPGVPGSPGPEPPSGLLRRAGLAPPAVSNLDEDLQLRLGEVCTLLWSRAGEVDGARAVPADNLAALAEAGFYGIFAPPSEGGLGLGYPETCAVVEQMASACATTAFVWAQHLRFLGAMLDPTTPAHLRQAFRAGAITGTTKAGVALTGLMPGPPRLSAEAVAGGWVLQGEAPWVSGWGTVDQILIVARQGAGHGQARGGGREDRVVTVLLQARDQPGLTAAALHLSALNASWTVGLHFQSCFVGEDSVISQEEYDVARRRSERLRLNGSFALGLAQRCCTLVGPSPLDEELRRCREMLDRAAGAGEGLAGAPAEGPGMPAARAAACELAMRCAHVLAVQRGSRSALAGDVAERSSREAALLAVFASRPAIKEALLGRLGALPATLASSRH